MPQSIDTPHKCAGFTAKALAEAKQLSASVQTYIGVRVSFILDGVCEQCHISPLITCGLPFVNGLDDLYDLFCGGRATHEFHLEIRDVLV